MWGCRLYASSWMIIMTLCITEAIVPVIQQQHQPNIDSFLHADVEFVERSHLGNRHAREVTADLEVLIDINSDKLALQLQRTFHLEDPVSVFTSHSGGLYRTAEILPQDYLLYQDVENGASILIHHDRDADESGIFVRTTTTRYMEGVFVYRGSLHYIYPSKEGSDWVHTNITHRVFEVNEPLYFGKDYASPVLKQPKNPPKSRLYKRAVTSRTQYEVELMIVADFSIYSFWLNQAANEAEADMLLRRYFAFLVNSVDLRYQSINESDMAFRVVLSGLYVAKTEKDSPWTEENTSAPPVGETRPVIDGERVIDDLQNWLMGAEQTALLQYDHVMLITAYDINKNRAGLAEVDGVCTDLRVSVVENNFDFIGALVSAHELGHSLGASHDGTGNPCSTADRYIMATRIDSGSATIGTNPWSFSPCSVLSFRELMETLNRENRNCLLVQNVSTDPITPPSPALGQLYDVDVQCQLSLGEGYTFCRSLSVEISGICTGLPCCKSDQVASKTIFPSRGTTCGDKQWCEDGVCVHNIEAPSINETCPFGDHPGNLSNSQTCAETITASPTECYKDGIRRQCCQSCDKYFTGRSDCQFGDKRDFCTSTNFTRYLCYTNDATCCESCGRLENKTNPACPYGDRNPSWCAARAFSPCTCRSPDVRSSCCGSCAGIQEVSAEECQCYDNDKNCSLIVTSRDCYKENIPQICCKTCKDYEDIAYNDTLGKVDQDCRYGNRFSDRNCEPIISERRLCYIDRNRHNCCATCALMRNDSMPDCPYQNRNSEENCEVIISERRRCYDNKSRESCCATCAAVRNDFMPGCEYGDRSQGCTLGLCADYPHECCGTCWGVTSETPTTKATPAPTTKIPSTPTTPTRSTSTAATPPSPTIATTRTSTAATTPTPTIATTRTSTASTSPTSTIATTQTSTAATTGTSTAAATLTSTAATTRKSTSATTGTSTAAATQTSTAATTRTSTDSTSRTSTASTSPSSTIAITGTTTAATTRTSTAATTRTSTAATTRASKAATTPTSTAATTPTSTAATTRTSTIATTRTSPASTSPTSTIATTQTSTASTSPTSTIATTRTSTTSTSPTSTIATTRTSTDSTSSTSTIATTRTSTASTSPTSTIATTRTSSDSTSPTSTIATTRTSTASTSPTSTIVTTRTSTASTSRTSRTEAQSNSSTGTPLLSKTQIPVTSSTMPPSLSTPTTPREQSPAVTTEKRTPDRRTQKPGQTFLPIGPWITTPAPITPRPAQNSNELPITAPAIIGIAVGGAFALFVVLLIAAFCLLPRMDDCGARSCDKLFAPFTWMSPRKQAAYQPGDNSRPSSSGLGTSEAFPAPWRPWHQNAGK